jgi:hypothetical protein
MLFTARLYRPFFPVVYCSSIWSLITIVPLCVDPLYAKWVNVGGKVETGLAEYTAYVDTDRIRLRSVNCS